MKSKQIKKLLLDLPISGTDMWDPENMVAYVPVTDWDLKTPFPKWLHRATSQRGKFQGRQYTCTNKITIKDKESNKDKSFYIVVRTK